MEKKIKEEKCCGTCCWFCFEDTDGDGQCVEIGDDGYPMMYSNCCYKACKRYVSRQEMRHYHAVLLQASRWYKEPDKRFIPCPEDVRKATAFANQYMKVFSKL